MTQNVQVLPGLQLRSGLQVCPFRAKPPIQEVHWEGSATAQSLQGNLHGGIQVLLTNLNDGLHSKQFPAEQVLQLIEHGLHEVMTAPVRTGSNPLPHFSHSWILSNLQLVHPPIHLTHELRVA